MSDNPSAFPVPPFQPVGMGGEPYEPSFGSDGMSLRDYFAGQALAGLLASGPHDCEADGLAHDAYLHADAMLKARNHSAASDSTGSD